MPDQYEELVKAPELLGVQTLGTIRGCFRVVAETLPMKQAGVSRNIRREI